MEQNIIQPPEGYEEVALVCPDCGWEGQRKECFFGHDDFVCPNCQVQSLIEKVTPKEQRVEG